MPDQLFTYYIENPLVIISINRGSRRGDGFCLEIETWVIGKGGAKRRVRRGAGSMGKEVWELLGFGYLVCVLGIVLLLWWKVLVSGISEGWGCVWLVQKASEQVLNV
jgi:hypothetical protein